MNKQAITLKDVAKLANVSVGTVSRFINNHPSVSAENRKMIQTAIERLNYIPNPIAQRLAKGITGNLLLYIIQEKPIMTVTWLHELPIIQGIYDGLENRNYSLQIAINFLEEIDKIHDVINDYINSKSIDGILVLSAWSLSNRTLIRLIDSAFPFVLIGNINAIQPTNDILFDNNGAIERIVEYLFQLGHRRMAFICGFKEQQHASERARGFYNALKRLDLKINEDWVKYSNYSIEDGHKYMLEILSLEERPTAVICANDEIAAGAVKAIHSCGLKVPEDISVTGFDNSTVAKVVEPCLTTVDVPVFELGQLAIRRLMEHIDCPDKAISREILPCKLIFGASTGKAND